MRTTLVVVSTVFAVLLTGSAAFKLSHRPAAVESYRKAGVPESWLNRLAGVLLLAAAGLVVGLWWPLAGIAAAIGLVIYFVLAVGFHVRANDTAHVLTPSVLAGVSAAVVALQLAAP
jgi:ABC-type cobalamin transport system permease subunit